MLKTVSGSPAGVVPVKANLVTIDCLYTLINVYILVGNNRLPIYIDKRVCTRSKNDQNKSFTKAFLFTVNRSVKQQRKKELVIRNLFPWRFWVILPQPSVLAESCS